MALLALVWASSVSVVALAQAPAAPATAAPTPAPAPPATAPAAPAPTTAPPTTAPPAAAPPATLAPAPPPPPGAAPYTPPPGYMLVPVQQAPPAQTTPLPAELAYSEGQTIPPGYRVEERMRRGLVIAGAITTGVFWSLSVTGAVAADYEDNSGLLWIPVAGPWLMLASGGADDPPCDPVDQELTYCQDNAGLRAILVFDGLVQTAGGVMFVLGMTSKSKRLVRHDVALDVVPMRLGRGGHGLGVVGTF